MKKTIVLLVLAVLASGCATVKLKEDKTYYTKANVWYEKPNEVLTVYHKGEIIPVGTKVTVVNASGSCITFIPESNSKKYTLVNSSKYSNIGIEEFFNQYFSESDVKAEGGEFYNFTEEERKNIENGIIASGMSKEAVLMAYGYPPSHRTPDTRSNRWVYWISKFRNFGVEFKDNKAILDEKSNRQKVQQDSVEPAEKP
ncbi:MAG: hypothetical protein HQL27_00900 [Candidatus Omnitrophica bacterium]|nr:hypothetical protein [Candidatus Omnitrophota bacterium]